MKEKLVIIRNTVFGLMILCFFVSVGSFSQMCDILFMPLGLPALAVVLLTIWVDEPRIQKVFFLLAGGAGAAMFITCAVFSIMRYFGHTPGGDGGGITVPMLLGCPIVFIIGAVGAIVCLVRSLK
jgi:hypothetical protein